MGNAERSVSPASLAFIGQVITHTTIWSIQLQINDVFFFSFSLCLFVCLFLIKLAAKSYFGFLTKVTYDFERLC